MLKLTFLLQEVWWCCRWDGDWRGESWTAASMCPQGSSHRTTLENEPGCHPTVPSTYTRCSSLPSIVVQRRSSAMLVLLSESTAQCEIVGKIIRKRECPSPENSSLLTDILVYGYQKPVTPPGELPLWPRKELHARSALLQIFHSFLHFPLMFSLVECGLKRDISACWSAQAHQGEWEERAGKERTVRTYCPNVWCHVGFAACRGAGVAWKCVCTRSAETGHEVLPFRLVCLSCSCALPSAASGQRCAWVSLLKMQLHEKVSSASPGEIPSDKVSTWSHHFVAVLFLKALMMVSWWFDFV